VLGHPCCVEFNVNTWFDVTCSNVDPGSPDPGYICQRFPGNKTKPLNKSLSCDDGFEISRNVTLIDFNKNFTDVHKKVYLHRCRSLGMDGKSNPPIILLGDQKINMLSNN